MNDNFHDQVWEGTKNGHDSEMSNFYWTVWESLTPQQWTIWSMPILYYMNYMTFKRIFALSPSCYIQCLEYPLRKILVWSL